MGKESCADQCEEEEFCTAYELQPIHKKKTKAVTAAWVHGKPFVSKQGKVMKGNRGQPFDEDLQGTQQYNCKLFVTPITSASRKHRSCRSTVCATKVCDEESIEEWFEFLEWTPPTSQEEQGLMRLTGHHRHQLRLI